MPTFGDETTFAVQYELDPDHGGEWMFGKVCYWCNGTQVGDYDLGTSLRDVLFRLEYIESEAGKRANPRFAEMPAEQVFHQLTTAMFGRPTTFSEKVAELANDEQWARHIVLPNVDVFDKWKGFLIQTSKFDRLIFAQRPAGSVQEVRLRSGEFDEALRPVIKALSATYERETGRAGG